MNETAAAWVRGLPMRWALGGLVLALVWAALSIALQGGFATTPVGGYAYALLRIISLIVLPLCALAFVWGLSERGHLERSAAQSTARLQRAIKKYTARQTGKSFYCGVAFTLFTYEISRSFHQWNSADNISANISSVVGGAMLAIPIGILVGVFSRRALKRRLEGQPSDGDADHSARSATRLANMRYLSQGGKVTADKMIVFPSRAFLNRLTERAQEYGFRLGLAIVCGLMVFATYNDIARITRQLMHWG